MLSVQLHLRIPAMTASAVYTSLARHGRDLGCPTGPCAFTVSGNPVSPTTTWEAGFRNGTLRWVTEERGAQRAGDRVVLLLDGTWSCVDDGPGAAVTFVARLDLGLTAAPSREEARAARSFIDDAVGVMSAVLEGEVRVEDAVIQADRNWEASAFVVR